MSDPRLNAVRHGLLAKEPVLAWEDEAEWQALRRALRDWFRPLGPVESDLVDDLAVIAWRRRRLVAAETVLIEAEVDDPESADAATVARAYLPARLDLIIRYDAHLARRQAKALESLTRLQAARKAPVPGTRPPPALLPANIDPSGFTAALRLLAGEVARRRDRSAAAADARAPRPP